MVLTDRTAVPTTSNVLIMVEYSLLIEVVVGKDEIIYVDGEREVYVLVPVASDVLVIKRPDEVN